MPHRVGNDEPRRRAVNGQPHTVLTKSSGSAPAVRQQFANQAVWMREQSLQHVLEVDPRIVPTQLSGLHQTHHHSGALAGQFAAAEEPRISAHRPRAHQALDVVVVDADVAVVQETARAAQRLRL